MSFARESALTAGEQVILVQLLARLATYGLKTSDGATLHVQLLSLQQPIPRLCTSTGLVTSHLFFLRSSALRERWLACRLSHLQRRQSLFWWRSLTG